MRTRPVLLAAILAVLPAAEATADWARFRGPNGSGVSGDGGTVPVRWGPSENVKWKATLPGPGLSSPIVVGGKIFLTCWSGYGVDDDAGDEKDLRRHLLCFDRSSGKELWRKTLEAVLPEDEYRGMFTQNGYASHTPTSDGERVYAFFGKTGVVAFDMDGKRLWKVGVGTGSGPRGWGSASSPILYKNLVIVTASAESEAVVALDKATGKEVWKQEAEGFAGTWGTPILVPVEGGRQELILGVPYEIWGLNPDNGKLRWFCDSIDDESMCASVVAHDGVVYALGGRSNSAVAVRVGGKGDVNKTHVVWRANQRSRIGTPVLHGGRLYTINGGVLSALDIKTGKRVAQLRFEGGKSTRSGSRDEERRSSRRGRGRGGRGSDYSSPVVAGDRLYYFSRSGDAYVASLGDEPRQLSHNRLSDAGEEFSATPALSGGDLIIRSSTTLYCLRAVSTAASGSVSEGVPLTATQPLK